MTSITWKRIILSLAIIVYILNVNAQVQVTSQGIMVRIAEIEIYPQCLQEYLQILKEEAAASIKKEPGVIVIFPMMIQRDSCQIRIIEIYANKEAYQSHLKTPHFQHYKTSTQKMVKLLTLVDMDALDKQAMSQIFKKLQ